MYLRRSLRRLLVVVLVIGLLISLTTLAAVDSAKTRDRSGVIACAIVFFVVLVLPSGIPLLLYYKSDARRFIPHRDVLREDLKLIGLSEHRGVQFAAILYPETVVPPSHVCVAVFVQNCHATPRRFQVFIKSGQSGLAWQGSAEGVRLEGGESGVLVMLGFARPGLDPGEQAITYRIAVSKPDVVGARMIAEDAPGAPTPGGARMILVNVRPSDPKASEPAYAGLNEAAGYRMLFRPGESALNEAPLAFLSLTR
jgi:hypothetical protein